MMRFLKNLQKSTLALSLAGLGDSEKPSFLVETTVFKTNSSKWKESIAERNRKPRRKTQGRDLNQPSSNLAAYQ
jgi:hypothetical protein